MYINRSMEWIFFFFKQKTAYEMRISDWSSDVCSSDLVHPAFGRLHEGRAGHERPAGGSAEHRRMGPPSQREPEFPADHRVPQPGVAGVDPAGARRSEERRGGKGGGSTCRSRW